MVRTLGSFLFDLASRLGRHRRPRLPGQLDALPMHEVTQEKSMMGPRTCSRAENLSYEVSHILFFVQELTISDHQIS